MSEVIFDTPMYHDDGYLWCHITSDNLNDLHIFAMRIGLKSQWFQDKPDRPHYDIRSSLIRRRALKLGAVMVTRTEFITKIKQWYENKDNQA